MSKNGNKQGRVLSPVLFFVYVIGYLCELRSVAGHDCYSSCILVGALAAYTDSIVLTAPTGSVVRIMLLTCGNFTLKFNTVFNAIIML